MWSTSTAAAGLLLRQYAPTTARLFAQFRRLRRSLPPAELREFTPFETNSLGNANMMKMVRLWTCHMSSGHAEVCSCGSLQRSLSFTSASR